jgi:nucleoside-diphosphate-sugar epimerase
VNPPVVVLGATGQIGLFAISHLLEAGRPVWAITRDRPGRKLTGTRFLDRFGTGQFAELMTAGGERLGAGLSLLSCGPVSLASDMLQLGSGTSFGGWKRVVVIGTTSVLTKSDSPDANERSAIEEIQQSLKCIRRCCTERSIPLTVLHPTLIYGCGMDQNLSRVYRWIRRYGFTPIAKNARARRQPIHVGDLAATAVRALDIEPPTEVETPICGGSSIEYREMIGLLFDVSGRRRRFLELSDWQLKMAAGLTRLIPGSAPITSEMFRRQSLDMVFDDTIARKALDHSPRPFAPNQADFCLSPQIMRIRRALS